MRRCAPTCASAASARSRSTRSGKEALTEFKPIEHYGATRLAAGGILHTGRTHQIRVHAAYCGHPVAGDHKVRR